MSRVVPRWSPRRALLLARLWIPAVLWADRTATAAGQLALGAITWTLLVWWLAHESRTVRVQTAVVVVLATVVEFVFSGWLEVYVYRLEHVPAYVPPGHGLVYLAALGIGRIAFVRRHARVVVALTAVAASAWALWGLLLSGRVDVLGAFWCLCLLGFLRWGRSTLLYVGAFLVVSYLELLGTAWGVWEWAPRDTVVGWVPMGNPPSIAAGGYGWFDLYALLLTPWLVARATGVRGQLAASRDRAASWSRPLLEIASPRSGPGTPSSPVNRPPASVTTSDTPATS